MPRQSRAADQRAPSTAHVDEPLALRPIEREDRDLLLAWANDPVTRAASFRPAPIDAATHAAWLERRLADPNGRVWIGLLGQRPVGQVRVDLVAPGRGEVGISVASEARGRGIARLLLEAGMGAAANELGIDRFVALVRPGNEASLRLFAAAGFRPAGDDQRAGVACRVLELRRSS